MAVLRWSGYAFKRLILTTVLVADHHAQFRFSFPLRRDTFLSLETTTYDLCFNVYGPRLDPEGAYPLVIGYFLKLLKQGKTLSITGDGNQTRDFVHVRDVARANLLAMRSDKAGKGEVINIGTGKRFSVNYIAKLIGGPIEYIPPRIEPRDVWQKRDALL